MKYCIACGKAIVDETARFCPNCGHAIYTAQEIVTGNTLSFLNTDDIPYVEPTVIAEPEDVDEGYRIVLVSRGSCSLKTAREVIADLLGYSVSTVTALMDEMPVELADELNERQALVLAQALAEYGMEVTVVDENNRYVNMNTRAGSSVFSGTGELTAAALAILGTLTAANRVHRYRKYSRPSLLDILFRPSYKVRPPKHVRRKVVREPESLRRISVKKTPISTGIPAARKPQPARSTHQPPKSSARPASGGAGKPAPGSSGHQAPKSAGRTAPSGGQKGPGSGRGGQNNAPKGRSGSQPGGGQPGGKR
ncbi:MAG: zinc-ribbon domain-containing protein [Lachnospiraceae bacterium]|nr:zinc-ribbon domain-containing protein [Lachnospiraceae bacterium]